MVNKTYAAVCLEMAKNIGLGQIRRERAAERKAEAESATAPARQGRPKKSDTAAA